ncbi:MAG: exo-beta-N-acetylmuramidase NamZ domain-containing protein [Candidatus Bathyarchaeia archaeon]
MAVKTGIDVLLEKPDTYIGEYEVGLVTNPSGITMELIPTLDALHLHSDVKLERIFGPEHGARGDVQDGLRVESYIDEATELPVYSLYGEIERPTAEMLDGLDALVFDIQDVGARFYTYASTMRNCLEAIKAEGMVIIILDRPNPINGIDVEGKILQPDYESFLGMHPIPMRHGLTIGELSILSNEDIGADLRVVEMDSWSREMWFDETGLPWVQPSPNIPTPVTATVYPSTCLLEGVNISEERGTTRPFEYIGSPWIDGREWARTLNEATTPGAKFRLCHFTPIFGKYRNQLCEGVQVHILDRDSYNSVETGLHLLSTALKLWPKKFKWLKPENDDKYHFDLFAGTDEIRLVLREGKTVKDITEEWRGELDAFRDRCDGFHLY